MNNAKDSRKIAVSKTKSVPKIVKKKNLDNDNPKNLVSRSPVVPKPKSPIYEPKVQNNTNSKSAVETDETEPEEFVDTLTEYKNAFNKFDNDQSGFIDVDEVTKVMSDLEIEVDEPKIRGLIQNVDFNKNGKNNIYIIKANAFYY